MPYRRRLTRRIRPLTRFALGLLVAALLASCDASGDDPFSLTVSVRDASGAPVSGLAVFVDTDLGSVPPTTGTPGPSGAPFFLSAPFPNPFGAATTVVLGAGPAASGDAEIEVLDLDGRAQTGVTLSGVQPGQLFRVPLGATGGLTGRVLPGGVYVVRATMGGQSVERGLVRTEPGLGELPSGFRRALGTTDARGDAATDDRTLVPALYPGVPPLSMTDETGSELGRLWPTRLVTVQVTDGDRVEERAVEVHDGANRVDVRW